MDFFMFGRNGYFTHSWNKIERSKMSEKRKLLQLYVLDSQEKAIRKLFKDSEWDFDEVLHMDNQEKTVTSEIRPVIDEKVETTSAEELRIGYPVRISQPEEGEEECPHCFCTPCVTDNRNRQMWWEARQHQARPRNSNARKIMYKKFWSMLQVRGLWNTDRYKTRKGQALQRDPRRTRHVYHRRELMPNCVLKLVRGWLPNLPNTPYMGHMWE